jgi:hypothetical protein
LATPIHSMHLGQLRKFIPLVRAAQEQGPYQRFGTPVPGYLTERRW